MDNEDQIHDELTAEQRAMGVAFQEWSERGHRELNVSLAVALTDLTGLNPLDGLVASMFCSSPGYRYVFQPFRQWARYFAVDEQTFSRVIKALHDQQLVKSYRRDDDWLFKPDHDRLLTVQWDYAVKAGLLQVVPVRYDVVRDSWNRKDAS